MPRRSELPEEAEARLLSGLLARRPEAKVAAAGQTLDAFLAAANRHGVVPLLARTADDDSADDFPHAQALQREAQHMAAEDIANEHVIRNLLLRFDRDGIQAIVIKGIDLAYSVYERADVRPRGDTDLLIARDDRTRATRALLGAGFRAATAVGTHVRHQDAFVIERAGLTHVVDLHWRVSNPERFNDVLPFSEALAASEPRERLSPAARGLSRVHALVLACVHRAAHHHGSRRLIWLCDIDRLARTCSDADWKAVLICANTWDVMGILAHGLRNACEYFNTPLPATVRTAIDACADDDDAYLDPGARHATRILSDLRHAASWRARGELLGEHAFPSAAYMRDVYAPGSHLPLAALYALRIARGARRWLRRG